MSSSAVIAAVTPAGSTGPAPPGAVPGRSEPSAWTATNDGQLQYSYQPPPKASDSLQNQTRKTLSSLIHPSPIPNPSITQTHPMSKSSTHEHDPFDPISPTGTTGSSAQALSSQVGGHAGVLSSDDGSLIIKPCIHLERKFYDDLAASSAASVHAEDAQDTPVVFPFEALRQWVPKYYGTLTLEGRARQVGEEGETIIEEVTDVKHKDKFFSAVEENSLQLKTYIRKLLPLS